MPDAMSSRERMLAAIEGRKPDHTPCSFMIFNGLRQTCKDQLEFVEKQVKMGLDTFVGFPVRDTKRDRSRTEQGDLHGLPVRFAPEVKITEWREDRPGERYPILHRTYETPAGALATSVNKTEDWVQGDRVPIFDDFVIPRARKRLVTGPEDLPALKYLLTMPSDEDIAGLRKTSKPAKALAKKLDLLTIGEWGVLFDAACWLCGMEEITLAALDNPSFVEELFGIIEEWNRRRMEVILDEGVDLFIRRAWYETTDFWSPALYERFILPRLKRDVRTAHQAGAKLGLITTSAYTPLLDLYLESGIDVLIGLDPVQDTRVDFALTKQKLGGKVGLWGGVNGFVTMETGTPDEVREAVREAMRILAPGGGFILSPVDNVTKNDNRTRANVRALIAEWRNLKMK
ncbi:MAG: uroporphyrinogen decarboxylase family protein [Planctomycetota bacterium]